MKEMECWKAQEHFKNCEKCRKEITKIKIPVIGEVDSRTGKIKLTGKIKTI